MSINELWVWMLCCCIFGRRWWR